MVTNLSACVNVDSGVLVSCLCGKSEDEMLAVTKVGLNDCRYEEKRSDSFMERQLPTGLIISLP